VNQFLWWKCLDCWHLALSCLSHTLIVHLILIFIFHSCPCRAVIPSPSPSSLHHPNMYPHQPSWTKVLVNWNDLGSRCLEPTSKIWVICLDFETFNKSKSHLGMWQCNIYEMYDLATVVELCTFQQIKLQVAKKSCNVKYSQTRKIWMMQCLPIKSNDKLLHPFDYLLNVITRIHKVFASSSPNV